MLDNTLPSTPLTQEQIDTILYLQGDRKQVGIRLTISLTEALDKRAKELGLNRTEIIERFAIQGLLATEPTPKVTN